MNSTAFGAGVPASTFIATMKNYRALAQALHREVQGRFADPAVVPATAVMADVLTASTAKDSAAGTALADYAPLLRTAIAQYAQPVRATLMTEDWCGDSACNLPLLATLLPTAGVELRVFRGSEHSQLQGAYHARGIDHIPVLSFWDATGAEIGTWVERPVACLPRVDAWKAEHPQLMELYHAQKTDSSAEKPFAVLYRQMLEEMAGWYRADLWLETAREVVECVRASSK